jgi:hypothetical protein
VCLHGIVSLVGRARIVVERQHVWIWKRAASVGPFKQRSMTSGGQTEEPLLTRHLLAMVR